MPEVLAKTSGISLETHTRHVVEQARRWLNAFPFLDEKYQERTGEALRPQVLRAAEIHDQGKRHPTWQDACRKDARGDGGGHLLKANLRHEFASLDWAKKQGVDLTLPEKAAIAAHHSKLGYRHKDRWLEDAGGQFEEIWETLYQTARQWTFQEPERLTEKALNERFRIAGPRALLQLADTRASIQEKGKWVPDPESLQFEYEFPYEEPRGVQEVVKEGWDDPMMILRAPTGSGKTDASLLWARHQIRAGRADRCVVAMPTRFTSNSLALDVDETVSETGLYHSSAWHARYEEEAEGDEEQRQRAQEMHRMARLLATPVTVCTVDHLCMALTGTREKHHSIFYHLCNSCVVIDEADFYDPFVQANVQVLLRMLRQFDVPVLVMSATVPDAAKSFYDVDRLEEDTSDLDRTRCVLKDAGEADAAGETSLAEDVADILHPLVEANPSAAIIYANTVKRALSYYDWLRNHGADPILYHSRFTEPDKKRIEGELIDALGQEAWENDIASGIAVLTQIGEMSLNISAPVMVSELCPYDRLAQRAGRLARFEGMGMGTLHVVTPSKDGELYPAPYGEYDQDENEWRPGRPLVETREALRFGPHSAQDFIDAVDGLYDTPEAFSPSDDRIEQNRDRLHTHLQQDWLIVNAQSSDEEEGRTDEWRSRDIPPQMTVLTVCPDRFDSYADYRAFQQEHGVSVPAYQKDLAQRLNRLPEDQHAFPVADETEKAWYSPVYSSTEGLILDQKRERSFGDRCL
ncbi:MAG: CRISPR-associated helicase Cas3' [Candidatus Bipolaricaulia bacterium]